MLKNNENGMKNITKQEYKVKSADWRVILKLRDQGQGHVKMF